MIKQSLSTQGVNYLNHRRRRLTAKKTIKLTDEPSLNNTAQTEIDLAERSIEHR